MSANTIDACMCLCVWMSDTLLKIDVVQRAKVVSHLPSCSVWDRGLLVHLLPEPLQIYTYSIGTYQCFKLPHRFWYIKWFTVKQIYLSFFLSIVVQKGAVLLLFVITCCNCYDYIAWWVWNHAIDALHHVLLVPDIVSDTGRRFTTHTVIGNPRFSSSHAFQDLS